MYRAKRAGEKMRKEICYIMLGKQDLSLVRFAHGRLVKKVTGKPTSVKFDGDWVLKREEKNHSVLGFWHTHPSGSLKPSTRDRKTMRAWVDCFGRPLLCVIQNSSYKRAYLVSPVKHKRWRYVWSRQGFVYKIFRFYGVYS